MWSELGVGTENPRGTGQGRMWEIEEKKRKFIVFFSFFMTGKTNPG